MDGTGYAGYSSRAVEMKITPLCRAASYEIADHIAFRIKSFEEKCRNNIIDAVFKHYEEKGIKPDAEGILNTSGSFDGSWLTGTGM